MAPYRGPVFSQGRAWLPAWLAASSLQSDAAICETPSMFATSWKDLDEPILNGDLRSTPSSVFKDITNKSFPCLHLSDDTSIDASSFQNMEDFKTENKDGAYGPPFSQSKALVLQLSLSQTQATTDTLLKRGLIFEPEFEGEKNSKQNDNTIIVNKQQEGFELLQDWGASEKALNNDKAMIMEKPSVSPAAAQSTGSAELLNPPLAQQSSQFRGKHRTAFDEITKLQMKRTAEMLPSNVRERKKLKSKNMKAVIEDIQSAIGLTVATAETLVIADILNGCQMCQSAGPKAILDAALMLRNEREAFGLDCFTLEDVPCTASPYQEWDAEDLDDTALEEEFLGTLPIDSMKQPSCGNPCTLADVQTTECSIEAENALTTVGVDSHTEATTQQHHQAWCGETYSDALEAVERLIHTQPVLYENGDDVITSHDCVEAQLVALKDSFNSRWLGGWTGGNCDKDKQAGHNLQQTGKKRSEFFNFETSELTESCEITAPVENLLRCSENHQNKGSSCAVTSMPEIHAEALTAGSYAEILLALSQASVKCSLQEPLCSFVPCSVNAKLTPLTNGPAKCNGRESNDEMAVKLLGNGLTSDRACDNQNMTAEQCPVLEISPTEGVKRIHSTSLKKYSTKPLSPLVEATMQTTEKQVLKCGNCDQTDNLVKEDELTVPADKSALSGQCQLILQDSGLKDSSPLIWHRGKRRRLRACQVAESNLIYSERDDGTLANDGSAIAELFSEPGISSHKDCAGFKQATLAPKGDIQLQSLDNHITTEKNVVKSRLGVQEETTLKMRQNRHSPMRTKHKVYNRRGRGSTSSQLFEGIDFLITGFPASQKILCEEVSKKIQEHGGVILSGVPKFSSLDRQKMLLTTAQHSIIIAPQKVRTLKYLYGCAAGLLIVRPDWLDECITMKNFLFKHKYKGKGSVKQYHTLLCPDEAGRKNLIFSKIAAFLHGQRSYCSKLSLLIQHGGGKVVQTIKSLVQANGAKGSVIQLVVAEHYSNYHKV